MFAVATFDSQLAEFVSLLMYLTDGKNLGKNYASCSAFLCKWMIRRMQLCP